MIALFALFMGLLIIGGLLFAVAILSSASAPSRRHHGLGSENDMPPIDEAEAGENARATIAGRSE